MEKHRIIKASKTRKLNGIKKFLHRVRDINGISHHGMTPLINAIHSSQKKPNNSSYDDVILHLISAGANVRVRHPRNNLTALMFALHNNRSEEAVLQLINAGSDIKATCTKGKTALINAIQNGYRRNVIAELLNKGADVNQPSVDFTPLYCALSYKRSVEIVELLINSGADVHVRDWQGRNLLGLLCQEGCKIDGLCEYKQIIDMLIKNGVDINGRDNWGNTIIHNVNCNYLIYLALKSGVSIETQNHDYMTPLHQALLYYEEEKIKNLLSFNADPNCVDCCHNTPLHYNEIMVSEYFNSILLYHGADLLVENRNGHTPLRMIGTEDLSYFSINEYENSIKIMIRHYLLFVDENDLENELNELENNTKQLFASYINGCKAELNNTRYIFINEELTIYDFCQLKKFYHDKHICISIDEYKYDYNQIRDLLPIYQDLIIMRIKDNSKKKFRYDMIKNLERISVKPVSRCGTISDVQLVYDCWYNIGQYLNYKQLYSLFLASLEN